MIAAARKHAASGTEIAAMATPQFALNEPLTDAQMAQVRAVAEGWVQSGLSTQRCDRARAEEAVRQVYRTAGLEEPRQIVWMDSPMGGVFAVALMMNAAALQGQRTHQLVDRLRSQATAQLRGELESQLGARTFRWLSFQLNALIPDGTHPERFKDPDDYFDFYLLGDWLRSRMERRRRGPGDVDELDRNPLPDMRDCMWWRMVQERRGAAEVAHELDDVWDHVWCELEAHLGEQLDEQRHRQLEDPLKGQLGDDVWTEVVGREMSLWRGWTELATLSCAFPLAGLKNSPRLDALSEAFRAVGWWWPMPDAAVLTDRPTVIRRDREGRLHAENGPALVYVDGFRLYAWHGIRMPADVVECAWSVQQIMTEPDAEVRLCAIERMGWDEFVRNARLTEVDQCPDPANPGQRLLLYDVPPTVLYSPVRVLIRANATVERDGSRDAFGLMVPTDCATALSAAAWTSTSPGPNTRIWGID
jgi:hypothetical protein